MHVLCRGYQSSMPIGPTVGVVRFEYQQSIIDLLCQLLSILLTEVSTQFTTETINQSG